MSHVRIGLSALAVVFGCYMLPEEKPPGLAAAAPAASLLAVQQRPAQPFDGCRRCRSDGEFRRPLLVSAQLPPAIAPPAAGNQPPCCR